MTAHERPIGDVEARICCDASHCDAGVMLRGSQFRASENLRSIAEGLGWTGYAGRSQRHYCPDHGPAGGHRMRLVWGRP